MAEEKAYDLTGTWDLNYNADPSKSVFDKHEVLNFAPDGDPTHEPPKGYRARFISRVPAPSPLVGEMVTHAEVFTGIRPPTTVSPEFPLTVVAFYQGDPGLRGRLPYYSTWSGCLIVDYHTDPLHPKDMKKFEGYFAGIEQDRGRFEMKKRG
jgi:hypothetical protein